MIGAYDLTAPADGPVARTVRETLDALATPEIRNAVIRYALEREGAPHIPEKGSEVRSFVEGSLVNAVRDLLGEEQAEAVRDELAPIIERFDRASGLPPDEADSARATGSAYQPGLAASGQSFSAGRLVEGAHEPVSRPESEPLPPAPSDAEPTDQPETSADLRASPPPVIRPVRPDRLLLLATRNSAGLGLLSDGLVGLAEIHAVQDPLELLELAARETVVVLDAAAPSVRPETLVALAPELPDAVRVVLWGDERRMRKQLALSGQRIPRGWIVAGTAPRDVITVCRVLLA